MILKIFTTGLLGFGLVVHAGFPAAAELGPDWITEAEMKRLSNKARTTGQVLTGLACRFEEVENPGRANVRFKPVFEPSASPVPWGWTFDANAPNRAIEQQARSQGFYAAAEDYYEISGVTWVRCKVWHRE